MEDKLELADAARRLRQWQERLDQALKAGDSAKAEVARRFVTEYTFLVADLQKLS